MAGLSLETLCESVWTQIYQGYILPKKYGADKRKAHLSDLVLSEQITREQALERLNEPYYLGDDLQKDYEYVLRKFGLSEDAFEEMMLKPPVPHLHFPTDQMTPFNLFKLRMWVKWYRLLGSLKSQIRKVLGTGLWGGLKQRWLKAHETNLDSRLKK